MEAPDVLVLGGGGILGEAWMLGVLAGLEEATGIDTRDADAFLGTSAGSIVASVLASGRTPASRIDHLPSERGAPAQADGEKNGSEPIFSRLARTAAGAVMPVALRVGEPGGAFARKLALSRVPHGRQSLAQLGDAVDRSGVTFDGRLRVSAVALDSGRRVMFGEKGAPTASVADAVRASCSIPGYFEPVEIGGRLYVDGGAWSPTNLDRAPATRGTRVLCLNPTASLRPTRGSIFGSLGPVSRGIAATEALVVERRGAEVKNVSPDQDSAAAMGNNLMSYRGRDAVIAAGLAQGRKLGAGSF
jgi:NTE family protein